MSSDIGDTHYLPIYIIIILLTCILNAIITSERYALDYVDRNKIKELSEDDPSDNRVNHVMYFLRKPSKYHYADTLINYVLFIIGFVFFHISLSCATELSSILILVCDIGFLLAFIAVSIFLPRKLAAQSSESYALGLIGIQRIVYYITFPFVRLCVLVANILLLIARKDTDVDDVDYSEDRVMSMLDKGQETGEIKEEGRRMIDSIFEFDDLLAYEIMTPRTDVFMIDINDDKDEYFEEMMELTHSRIPVYEGDPDNIIGILHIKDYLYRAGYEGFDNVNIRDIIREPYFVPETKNIDSLFVELQKTKQHIAILIDEYGGFSGLVSIEDIIEQIVGDIDDEFDEDDRIIDKISDDKYIVDGNVYLDDLAEETGVELESETSETIGGFIIDLMGEIPKENINYQPIEFENYKFRILKVKDRRIEKVEIIIQSEDDDSSDENERK